MNKEDLIKKYEGLEGVWNANGAEIARQCFLRDLEQLNEIDTKKVTVPQFVADWIEEGKKHCKDVSDLFDFDFTNEKVGNWFLQERPFDLVARAWLDGYEVEKEKRYYVRFKFIEDSYSYLTLIKHLNAWTLTDIKLDKKFRSEHTKKQLEDAGFGWVFDCPGIEIEVLE
jgi:hypothetical protein